MAVNLNLEGAVRYLNVVPPAKLDGLAQALTAKLDELGVTPTSPLAPATQVGQEPSGNVRGVLRFIESVTADSDPAVVADLQALAGTVLARTGAINLQVGVTGPDAGEPPAPLTKAVAPVGPRGRRRRRKQR